jgi:hypothetical protein
MPISLTETSTLRGEKLDKKIVEQEESCGDFFYFSAGRHWR